MNLSKTYAFKIRSIIDFLRNILRELEHIVFTQIQSTLLVTELTPKVLKISQGKYGRNTTSDGQFIAR